MPRRQPRPLPTIVLMTDERMGDGLWSALRRLPRGAAVVFRHYTLPPTARRALFERVRRIARARQLWLLVAGAPRLAVAWRADGAHCLSPHRRAARPLLRSAPCHDRPALIAARRAGCALRLVSPIHPTRSHPGARVLGRVRLGLLIGSDREGIVALGGMDRHRATALKPLGVTRWAAIDGLAEGPLARPNQKRKAVPI